MPNFSFYFFFSFILFPSYDGFLRPSYKKAAPFSALFSLKRIWWWTGTVMTLSLGYTIQEPTFCVCGSYNPFFSPNVFADAIFNGQHVHPSDEHENLPRFASCFFSPRFYMLLWNLIFCQCYRRRWNINEYLPNPKGCV